MAQDNQLTDAAPEGADIKTPSRLPARPDGERVSTVQPQNEKAQESATPETALGGQQETPNAGDPADGRVRVQPVKLPAFSAAPAAGDPDDGSANLGLVLGVPLEVSVEIGKTRMSVKEILEIRQGSLIELDRQAGDPVDIMVNGQLIARGDVVVIDDDFGVRVTEILSEKSRLTNTDR